MKRYLPLLLLLPLLWGCKSTPPTKFERTFANIETNYVPKLVTVTNIVELVRTNTIINVVTVTNEVGVPIPMPVTNYNTVTTFQTNVVLSTNMVPVVTMTPSNTAKEVAGGVGGVVNTIVPGLGSLVTEGLLGALALWLGYRSRQLSGKNDTLSQAAGVLAQTIETGREIMSKTPQGQAAANAFTQWMITHQAETQTVQQISSLVKNVVDNEEAKRAADQILALITPKP